MPNKIMINHFLTDNKLINNFKMLPENKKSIPLRIIIDESISGNTRMQELLYKQHAVSMYYVCLRYVKNIADAEDVLQEGFIKVFKNGVEVLADAYKIGNYGFKGTKAFNEIVNGVRKGGNFVANSKEEAMNFVKEAFPDALDESGKAASKYGYRVDEAAEAATSGTIKNGHHGNHINYYDKKNNITGSISY